MATYGDGYNRHVLRRRFHTACRTLDRDRLRTLTIHHGRHTFISHTLTSWRTLADVRAAAGRLNVVTTSLYLHIAVEDAGEPGDLFGLAIWGRLSYRLRVNDFAYLAKKEI